MSNFFNINRFSKVVIRDIVSNCLLLVFRGLLFFGVYYLLMVLGGMLLFDFTDISASFRYKVISYVSIIMMLIVPFVLYNNVSNRKKGVDYILLPASSLEKYLSMLIVTIIIGQVIIILTGFAVDTLFSAIFPSVFEGFAISNIDFVDILKAQGEVLFFVSTGIAGNLIFRKHKVLKTLSVFIVFTLIFIFVSSSYIVSKFVNQTILSINNKEYTIKELSKENNLKESSIAYIEYDNNKQIKETHGLEELKQKFGASDSTIVDFKSLMKNVNKSNYSVHRINLKAYNTTDLKFYVNINNEEVSYAVITKDNAEYLVENSSYQGNNFSSAFSEFYNDLFNKIIILIMWIFPIALLLLSYIRLRRIQM